PSASHVSPVVQAFPSLQVLPTSAVCWQPTPVTHESLVQGFESSQFVGVPPVQLPLVHFSPVVHGSLSEHAAPSADGGCVQMPSAQTSRVHGSPSSVHVPLRFVKTHPLAGLQVSFVHSLLSLQTRAGPPTQVPEALHVSLSVQALPSLHAAPTLGRCWQPTPGTHVSVVHGFVSAQFGAVPCWQVPKRHTSDPLHTLPSSHDVLSATGVCRQPSVGLHVSAVQGVLSLQFSS